MKLPNPHKAFMDSNKLLGYSLNTNHADGQHKARVFKSALNITTDDVHILTTALLNAVQTYEATPDKSNPYGQKYIIDLPLTHEGKTAIIHSV